MVWENFCVDFECLYGAEISILTGKLIFSWLIFTATTKFSMQMTLVIALTFCNADDSVVTAWDEILIYEASSRYFDENNWHNAIEQLAT